MKLTTNSVDPGESLRTNGGWQFTKRPDAKTDTSYQFYAG